MKDRIKLLIASCALPLSLFLTSCGEKKDETIAAPEGMNTLDLSRFGKPFAIFVPDTSHTKMEITEQPSGALEIRVGKNYGIAINENAADIELKRSDIKDDEVNRFKSYIKEDKDAIMWESEITQPEYHFLMNKKVGGTVYSFEDLRDAEGNPFGKDAVAKMFESANTAQPVGQSDASH